MRILTQDDRQLEGTAVQIVQQMKNAAHQKFDDLSHYMRWAAERALAFEGITLCLNETTEELMAESFIAELLLKGLIRKV